jgi:hypothetical protein
VANTLANQTGTNCPSKIPKTMAIATRPNKGILIDFIIRFRIIHGNIDHKDKGSSNKNKSFLPSPIYPPYTLHISTLLKYRGDIQGE